MQLIAALLDLCKKSPAIIAIDGPAGAGKTTLAGELKASIGTKRVAIVHMDDLYGGWELSEDFTSRLLALVRDISQGKAHEIHIYDWHQGRFSSTRTIDPVDIVILEGVGSGQSAIRPYLSALIWMDIEDSQGLTRVLNRDGDSIRTQMLEWQNYQREHFLRERTRESADFELTT